MVSVRFCDALSGPLYDVLLPLQLGNEKLVHWIVRQYHLHNQIPRTHQVHLQQVDTFLNWKFAVAPCAVLGFLTHLIGSRFSKFDVIELLWTFSIYLESIAILPQLIVLQRYREVENLMGNYIFFMGAYRALYILNWIYRANYEPNYTHHPVVYFCGVLQTFLYADFFYYYVYFQSKSKGGKFTLPTTAGKK